MATSLTGARRLGPLLKRTKELEPLLDDELRFFFGNEMSASLDLTALNVVGNVLPGGAMLPKNACPPQAKTGMVNLRVQPLRFSRSSRSAVLQY